MVELIMNPAQTRTDRATNRPEANARYIDSRELLGHDGNVKIRHRDQVYNLRQTRTGKLILTK
jgi:hemin uptake protein HemP